jgi:uncharacterized protein YhbP (UPF0306 family)
VTSATTGLAAVDALLQVAAMTLAIVDPTGAPHAAPVYFAALPANAFGEPPGNVPVELLGNIAQEQLRRAALPHAAAPDSSSGSLPCPWQLVFFSSPDSLHARCLETNPVAAAAIYPETPGWQDIRGLQLHGRVRSLPPVPPGASGSSPVSASPASFDSTSSEVSSMHSAQAVPRAAPSTPAMQSALSAEAITEWQIAWQAYLTKFPFAAGLEQMVARNSLHFFTPTWVRLVDNRQGFGFRQEWLYA